MVSSFLIILLLIGWQTVGSSDSVQQQDTLGIELDAELTDPPFFQFPADETEVITRDQLDDDDHIIYIRDQWRFMPGDNMEWADPDFDDSGWEFTSTNLTSADLSFIEWNGIGWFRKKLKVEEELRGKPIALIVDRHLGASEIFLNGEKVLELGQFSIYPENVKTYSSSQPPVIVFSQDSIQTFSVRFTNPDFEKTNQLLDNSGFRFLLGDWEYHHAKTFSSIAFWTGGNLFYIGILLAFSLIHFLIFFFYPVEKKNLYFSLFVAGIVVISYLLYRIEITNYTIEVLSLYHYMMVAEVLVLVLAARFTHSLDSNKSGVYVNTLFAAGLIVALFIALFPSNLFFLRDIAILLFLVEILRSLFLLLYRKRSGIWILGSGVMVFVLGLITSILINFELIQGNVSFVNMAASGTLIMSMSIYLSREFAATQKKLENKLYELQEMSKRALKQEKINKEREIEKRLLEAENQRKSDELEEARALQLSMLPKKMPANPNYDLAVYMQTATEVGGDYYDYSVEQDGAIVLALGDATGHGLKAGIMVAAAKSYFHTLVHETDILTMLKRMSSGLRNLNMRLMYMGLILVHCRNNELEITLAGMPPLLHYCKKTNTVNKIVLKGLPLGGKVNYPYEKTNISVEKGDVLLMMSDGLIELFNDDREMFGFERVQNVLVNSNGYSAGDIITQLKQQAESWTGGKSPHDDITLMVLKIQ